ncbi:aldose 1-epimerase [Advenella faeciporci]|uniref:Aldose 1-epimerase n=1 Tax=Advenella faeciporci TaxID=797535 RepID=A0A918JP80_9BURK|nr:aldose 1-epimerase [Advenella faeciporci]GGW94193.1 aldose 1-epimerase [Advenella faeciporci]
MKVKNVQQCLELKAGDARLVVAPHIGGAIVAYKHVLADREYHWLRPVDPVHVQNRDVSGMASFPLVPWAGRLRDGRFVYEGRRIHYPSQKKDSPHSIHGFLRNRIWQVTEHTDNRLVIEYVHEPDDWPFAFRAQQVFALDENNLTIYLDISNTGQHSMPLGMGHHPYFPKNEHTRLTARVGKAWYGDQDVMPVRLAEHPLAPEMARGIDVARHALDTPFMDWEHEAQISWPDEQRKLVMTADAPFDFLIVYSPEGAPWFCAEPFSNVTDCFNMRHTHSAREVGGQDVLPGQTVKTRFSLTPVLYKDD